MWRDAAGCVDAWMRGCVQCACAGIPLRVRVRVRVCACVCVYVRLLSAPDVRSGQRVLQDKETAQEAWHDKTCGNQHIAEALLVGSTCTLHAHVPYATLHAHVKLHWSLSRYPHSHTCHLCEVSIVCPSCACPSPYTCRTCRIILLHRIIDLCFVQLIS